MNEVFGINPFSSKSEVLNPIVNGKSPVFVFPFVFSETNSVISLNSNFSLIPYFHNVEG
jgi:hypothetical protein